MPFTPAHTALIFPFLKLKSIRLSATGLVMGSLAPDFEYFLRLETLSSISHYFTGIFVFNIPVAFLLALLFHVLVRPIVVAHLPDYFKARALAVKTINWPRHIRKHWLMFMVSAALGAASHIFWDGFTYEDGYFVKAFPVLESNVWLAGFRFQICRIIQHLSTVVGLVVVFRFIHHCPTVPLPETSSRRSWQWFFFWLKIFACGFGFLFLTLLVRYRFPNLQNTVVTLISGWLLVLLAICFYKMRNRIMG